MILMMVALAAQSVGTLERTEAKPAEADYVSRSGLGEIERCLISSPEFGLPTVYRQPDRPNASTLVWLKWGDFAGALRGHVRLEETPAGTHVRSWMPANAVLVCAPKAG